MVLDQVDMNFGITIMSSSVDGGVLYGFFDYYLAIKFNNQR